MGSITIKQPAMYISYDLPDWVEPYDRTLVLCECGSLMERGMGLCDKCIDRETLKMKPDSEEILNDVGQE